MSGYIILGSNLSPVVKPAAKPATKKTRDKRSAMILFGLPVIGAGLGWLTGRPLLGGIVGGAIGLAACTTDNPDYIPGLLDRERADFAEARGGDGGAGGDDLSREDDLAERRDLGIYPDMSTLSDMLTSTPDMTEKLDMSGSNCVPTLADVGGGDFTIRFVIQTTAGAFGTVMYQRNVCNAFKDWWDVTINSDGNQGRPAGGDGLLTIWVNQAMSGLDPARISTTIPVNDGRPHQVIITRRSGTIYTITDGMASGQGAADQKLGSLPPIGISSGHPCKLPDLVGIVSNVCLTIP